METNDGASVYVITEDIRPLMMGWGIRRRFKIPGSHFFVNLSERLKASVEAALGSLVPVESIPHHEITRSVKVLRQSDARHPWVSLDDVYFGHTEHRLDVTRTLAYDPERGLWYGDPMVASRNGRASVTEQLNAIAEHVRRANGKALVNLFDDGCWKGETLRSVVDQLQNRGVDVARIAVAIKIHKEGADSITSSVEAVHREFPAVVDWVCQRDFLPGIPLSGRTVRSEHDDYGVTYLYIPGRPELGNAGWASLSPAEIGPERSAVFSQDCLHLAIALFTEIEKVSDRPVRWDDIERKPFGLCAEPGDSFVEVLREQLLAHYDTGVVPG